MFLVFLSRSAAQPRAEPAARPTPPCLAGRRHGAAAVPGRRRHFGGGSKEESARCVLTAPLQPLHVSSFPTHGPAPEASPWAGGQGEAVANGSSAGGPSWGVLGCLHLPADGEGDGTVWPGGCRSPPHITLALLHSSALKPLKSKWPVAWASQLVAGRQ